MMFSLVILTLRFKLKHWTKVLQTSSNRVCFVFCGSITLTDFQTEECDGEEGCKGRDLKFPFSLNCAYVFLHHFCCQQQTQPKTDVWNITCAYFRNKLHTLKATSAEDRLAVRNINIAPKRHIWTIILHYNQKSSS